MYPLEELANKQKVKGNGMEWSILVEILDPLRYVSQKMALDFVSLSSVFEWDNKEAK